MKKLMACAVAIVAAVILAAPVWAHGAGPSGTPPKTGFVVINPDHVQKLGGTSTRAWRGLMNAALHSSAVQCIESTDPIDEDDTIDLGG